MQWLLSFCLYRSVLGARRFGACRFRGRSAGCRLGLAVGQSCVRFSFDFVADIAKTTRAINAAKGPNGHLPEGLAPMAPQLDRFTDKSPIIAATGKCRQFAIRVDGELEPHSVVRSVEACQRYPAPFTECPLEGNGVSSAGQNDRGVSPRSSHQQECRPRMTLDAEKEALRPCPNTSRQYLGLD